MKEENTLLDDNQTVLTSKEAEPVVKRAPLFRSIPIEPEASQAEATVLKEEPIMLNEVHTDSISSQEIEKVNEPEILLDDVRQEENTIPSSPTISPIPEPNAFTGTYLLMGILMLGMILLSLIGLTLS